MLKAYSTATMFSKSDLNMPSEIADSPTVLKGKATHINMIKESSPIKRTNFSHTTPTKELKLSQASNRLWQIASDHCEEVKEVPVDEVVDTNEGDSIMFKNLRVLDMFEKSRSAAKGA